MKNADKFAWKFLIDNGKVIGKWDYYGSMFEMKEHETKECLNLIESVGIDWAKTKPVRDSSESGFEGTFSDSSIVKTMEGELVLLDGTKWKWGTEDVDPMGIIRYMAEFLPDPFGE